MAAPNPKIILSELNSRLSNQVELTLFGRAALNLGFDPPINEKKSRLTHDVDVIVALDQEKSLDQNDDFWQAVEKANNNLSDKQLYLNHIFLESQIIIGTGWKERRQKIILPELDKLILFRPSCMDLVLTKMARANDLEDRKDIVQLLIRGNLTAADMEEAFRIARYPDEEDLIEQFAQAKAFIRLQYQKQREKKGAPKHGRGRRAPL